MLRLGLTYVDIADDRTYHIDPYYNIMVFNFIMIAQLIAHEIVVININANVCEVLSVDWFDSTLSNLFESCIFGIFYIFYTI